MNRTPISRRALLRHSVAVGASATVLGWMELLGRDTRRETVQAAPAPGQAGRGRWLTKAALPFPRTEISVTGLDGKVYVLGGYAHGRVDQPFNQVYDPTADAWRDLAPMPRGRRCQMVAIISGSW